MRGLLSLGSIVLLGLLSQTSRAGDKLPTSAEVRKAVERSLPYLEKEGVNWIEKRNCHSCHHIAFLLWSHHEAKAQGVAVDEKKLAEWNEWSRAKTLPEPILFNLPEKSLKAFPGELHPKLKALADKRFGTEKEFVDAVAKALTADELAKNKTELVKHASVLQHRGLNGNGSLDIMGQLLLGRDLSDKSDKQTAFVTRTAAAMPQWQELDSTFSAGNQFYARRWRERPIAEQVSTMWALVALAGYDKPDPRAKKSIEQTQAALKKAKPDPNAEWLVVRLLFEQKFGTPEQAATLHKDLRTRQNPDGGWSVLPAGKSDPFSTGQSLYALRLTGIAANDPAVGKAQKFLIDTQLKSGAWPIRAGDLSTEPNPERLKRLDTLIYGYWGSAWASIGLSRSLGVSTATKKQ